MTFLSSWTCPPGSSMCDSKSTCLTVNKICFLVRLSLPYFLVNGTTLSFWNSSYQSRIYSLLFASPFILIWLPFHNSECAYLLPIALHLFHSNGIGLTNNSFLESKMCLVYQDNWFPRFIFFGFFQGLKNQWSETWSSSFFNSLDPQGFQSHLFFGPSTQNYSCTLNLPYLRKVYQYADWIHWKLLSVDGLLKCTVLFYVSPFPHSLIVTIKYYFLT